MEGDRSPVAELEFKLLGPLRVERDGCRLPLGGLQQRSLLAMLLIHRRRPVSADALIEALYGDDSAHNARPRLQVAVARLRRALTDDPHSGPVATEAAGYRLDVGRDDVDADRFERLHAAAREDFASDKLDEVIATLDEALGLWYGRALADVEFHAFAQPEIARLEELRLTSLGLRVDAMIALGHHAEVLPELEGLAREHPLRERLIAQLMLSLYREGRHAEALDVYRAARRRLADELGLAPGHELRRLEQAILEQSPELQLGAPPRHDHGLPTERGLPLVAHGLIGRDLELAAIRKLLVGERRRMVTVTGPGGVGKTRLAIEAARSLAGGHGDGAVFVDLTAARTGAELWPVIREALHAEPVAGDSAESAALRQLRRRSLLLVLDNLEHVLPEAAQAVSAVVRGAEQVAILGTSREAIGLATECVVPLEPLAVPIEDSADVESLRRNAAVRLLVERARARQPAFELTAANARTIAAVCRRLDGLPLALELAAARLEVLTPEELRGRLNESLDVLSRGARDAPERHKTLRATVAWSYRLLRDSERAAFSRFAVFAGGCTLEAAEQVTGASLEVLHSLVDKHLITRRTSQVGARFLLLDLVRQYASERLSDEYDEPAARAMHCDYFIRFAAAADEHLRRPRRAEWLALVDAEMPNVRAALSWAQATGESERALRLAGPLAMYWFVRDKREGRERLEAALGLPRHDVRPATRAKALAGRALLGPSERGVTVDAGYAREGLQLYRELGDAGGEAACLGSLAFAELYGGHPREARELAGKAAACARRSGDRYCLAVALDVNAAVARTFAEARACAEEASAAFRHLGDMRRSTTTLFYAVFQALKEGADAEANEIVKGVTPSALAAVDASSLPYVLTCASAADLFNGETEVALVRLRDALEHCRETGQQHPLPEVLFMLAVAAAQRDSAESAARLLAAASAIRHDLPETPVHHRSRKLFLDPCLRRLDDARLAASEAAGRAMAPSEAVDHGSAVAAQLLAEEREPV